MLRSSWHCSAAFYFFSVHWQPYGIWRLQHTGCSYADPPAAELQQRSFCRAPDWNCISISIRCLLLPKWQSWSSFSSLFVNVVNRTAFVTNAYQAVEHLDLLMVMLTRPPAVGLLHVDIHEVDKSTSLWSGFLLLFPILHLLSSLLLLFDFFLSFKGCVKALSGVMSIWNSIPHYFQKIFFLTDGTCGGACSLALSKLQVEGYAKVISIGGIAGQLMDTSFAGGYIENFPEFFEEVRDQFA